MVLVATQVKRRRGTTAENDAFTGAEGEIVVDIERHELRVHDGVTQGGFKIGGGSGSGRNIGDIFMTTRTDTALAGAVECNGGTYSTADYTGDGSIGELLASGKLDYISLTNYATAISTKGWCDKIGWDGAGTTSFRVPTLTPHIIQTNNIPVVGNGVSIGYTDGTNLLGEVNWNSTQKNGTEFTISAYNQSVGTSITGVSEATSKAIGLTTDGTKSGIIADTSDTAQLRVMFQLFNGTTDEAVATVGTVVAQVGELNTRTAGMIDYVVEKQDPTADNGYTWYRKYKSGWVEQGGVVPMTSPYGLKTVVFPVAMSSTNFTVSFSVQQTSNDTANITYRQSSFWNLTTTSFDCYDDDIIAKHWQVSGMSAQ